MERNWTMKEGAHNAKETGFCLAGGERSLINVAGLNDSKEYG